jgi:hypothetical protein
MTDDQMSDAEIQVTLTAHEAESLLAHVDLLGTGGPGHVNDTHAENAVKRIEAALNATCPQ